MAQSGYTPISLYFSATGAAVPVAGNLVAGELALNTNDGKLYYKNSSGVVTLLAGATAGPAGGSNTQIQFNSSGALAGSSNLTWNGTTLAVTGAATVSTTLLVSGVATFQVGPAISGTLGITNTANTMLDALTVLNASAGNAASTRISLGNNTSGGAGQIILYGGNHATLPNYMDVTNANNALLRLQTGGGATSLGGTLSVSGTSTMAAINASGAITGSAGFVNTSAAATNTQAFTSSTTTTAANWLQLANTGGTALFGIDDSAASVFLGGNYTTVIRTTSGGFALQTTAGTNALTVSTAGAVSILGTLSVTGTSTMAAINASGQLTAVTSQFTSGADSINNGGFSSSANWVLGANWSIGSGVATAATASSFLYQSNTGNAAKVYALTFTVTAYTSGTIQAWQNAGGGFGPVVTAAGTYTAITTGAAWSNLGFSAGAFVGSIDNVSLKEVSVYANGSAFIAEALSVTGAATIQTLTVGLGAGAVASNTAVGVTALSSNTTGSYNDAFGFNTLNANTTASFNAAFGSYALYTNTTGASNAALGMQALALNTTGNYNAAVGYRAGYSSTTGSQNVFVGNQAGFGITTGQDNQFIGYLAGRGNTTASYNAAIGTLALGSVSNNGGSNVGVGYYALSVNTGANNVAVGKEALTANTTADNNTAVGYQALYANTTGSANVAVGNNVLDASTTASYNSAFGAGAMGNTTTGSENCSFGFWSLLDNSTGGSNTAFGTEALRFNTTASNNTAVGYQALKTNTTAQFNVAVGYQAGVTHSGTVGYNTCVGAASGTGITTGGYNTCVGGATGYYMTTGSGNIAIGGQTSGGSYSPAQSITTQNDYISMGSTSVTNAYIGVAWTVVSDARDKTNITPITHGLSFVTQLNPVSYKRTDNRTDKNPVGDKQYGFLAQDILKLEGDDAVIIDNKDLENLKYKGESLVPVLVKAIQELNADFQAYKNSHP